MAEDRRDSSRKRSLNLESLYDDYEFKDVAFDLSDDNDKILAHKCILALKCTALRERFRDWYKNKFSKAFIGIRNTKEETKINDNEPSLNSIASPETNERGKSTNEETKDEESSDEQRVPIQRIVINGVKGDSFKTFVKYCYTENISKEELEKHEDDLYSLGEQFGCEQIFQALDSIDVKLPIRRSNSLKALLSHNISDEVKKEAQRYFQTRASEILNKYNLYANKKRIKKNLRRFEELFESSDLNMDESTILDLVLDLPALLNISDYNKKKETVERFLGHIKWDRVGLKSLVKAYISNFVPSDVIEKYAMLCLKRMAVGGDGYGLQGLIRATYESCNDKLKKVRHSIDKFNMALFEQKDANAFNIDKANIDKVIVCGKDYANIIFGIQASSDGTVWTNVSLIRHIKGDCEVEWKPIYKFPIWRVVVKEHSGSKLWFNYIEWFRMKHKLYEEPDEDDDEDDDNHNDEDSDIIISSKRKPRQSNSSRK